MRNVKRTNLTNINNMNTNQNIKKTAMILAGGLMFAGSAGAATTFFSTFDDDTSAVNDGSWTGFSTYAYSANYTLTPPPSSGSHYANVNAGPLTTTIDITNAGADTAVITAGNMTFDFSAYLGSWTSNADRGQIGYQFLDSGSALIGTATIFDDNLGGHPNGTWTQYGTTGGAVPTNARSVIITIEESVNTSGSTDGYADLVSFTTSVPEPSSVALLGLGGLSLILRRRK